MRLAIHGLGCGGGGALTVEKALRGLDAVREVYVNPLTEIANVDFDGGAGTIDDLVATVEDWGYRATPLAARPGESPAAIDETEER